MMLIRQATDPDIPAIMALIRLVVPQMRTTGNLQWDNDYPNREAFARDIALGQLWVVTFPVRSEGSPEGNPPEAIAAVAALTNDQDPEYADVGWDITEPAIVIHRLAVHSEHQGKGLAVVLIKHAEHLARSRSIDCIRLDTNTQNQATQRLLPKLGYSLAGEIGLQFRPGLRFFCYEKRLSQPEL